MNAAMHELVDKLQHKRVELKSLLDKYRRPDSDGFVYDDGVPIAEIRKRTEEINAISKQLENARTLANADKLAQYDEQQVNQSFVPAKKSDAGLVETFMREYKSNWRNQTLDISDYDTHGLVRTKTLFQTTAGYPPFSIPLPGEAAFPVYEPALLDRVRIVATDMNAVPYYEESSWTNAANPKAQGAAADEATFALTLKTVPVERIPVWIPATQEQLDDRPEALAYLESRLTLSVRQTLENQVLNGTGTAPNLTGILNATGINTQAVGTDPRIDAIGNAISKCEGAGATPGFAVADMIVLHPTDWVKILLTRDVNGNYILGNPGEMIESRLWGLPVVKSNMLTAGTGLVGAFANYHAIYLRRAVTINITDSHADNFVKDIMAIKAVLRAANIVFRARAFCKVTGL